MVASNAGARKREEFVVARFVDHPSFHEKNASVRYRSNADPSDGEAGEAPTSGHLPDEVTRELAKRMHYAAFRLSSAAKSAEARVWRNHFLDLRDKIILGNRKLIYRAVQNRVRDPQLAEDCAAECHVVMIRVVTCYNPWLGIRFSTFAFTCLLRELTRLVQKQIKDRLRQAASFDDGLFNEASEPESNEAESDGPAANVRQFFATEHRLLSGREKQVLSQRFGFASDGSIVTLKDIGGELNLSKERVRQLQNSGLEKLREVLAPECVGV